MIVGLIILILGIVCLINEMNLGIKIEFDLLWPLVMIVFSLGYMIKNKKLGFWSTLFMFIGIWYTLYYFNIITVSLDEYLWPVILIILGGAIISSKISWDNKAKEGKSYCKVDSKDGKLTYDGIFGGIKETVKKTDFVGCIINAIFGSVELDLREIKVEDNITIDANSIFGGIDLRVPDDYNIVVNSFAIFGGNENKADKKFDEKRKTIYINCVSIFGGTEIK
ncbi:MAG TPA: LiaF-related protein [Bacilli bacterium]|nr:LiaF-related protein [Bacilli bacterium]